MQNVQATLHELNSNGVECGLNELVRYRPVANKLNLRPAGAIRNSMSGTMVSRIKGRGMEFDEARHYQPGDDIRSIDWRVTARTGKTHTKLFREERERPVLIYVDLDASMHFGSALLYKSVQALHAASLITFSALSRGDKVGCAVLSDTQDLEVKPKSSSKHALAMLNQMVKLQQTSLKEHIEGQHQKDRNTELPKDRGIGQLAMLAKPGSLVYLLSDFSQFSPQSFVELGRIARHCEVKPLRIFDPLEVALPSVNGLQDVLVTDGNNEQHFTLGDKSTAESYSAKQMQWFNTLQKHIQSAGLTLRQVSAAIPLEQQLFGSKQGLTLGSQP